MRAILIVLLISSPALAQDYESLLAKVDVSVPGDPPSKKFEANLKRLREKVNRRDVESWRTSTDFTKNVAAMKKALGTFPALAPDAKVASHVTRSFEHEGVTIDNLVYESRPGLWVTANLYRPTTPPKSAPAILIIHSHHNPKTEGELQDMGMQWARVGCYVLVPDQLGHGERRQHGFSDPKSFPESFKAGRQDYYFRYNLAVQLQLVGETLIGWMANDMIAGVSLLLKQPGVDPERIVLLGAVAGGGDPAAVTAALDPRIDCVVPFNFGGPQPESKFPLPEDADTSFNFMGSGGWESTRNLADSAPLSGDTFLPWQIVASIAPRKLIHAHEFSWDPRDPVWKRYETVWKAKNAATNIGVAHGKGVLSGRPPEASHCNNIGPTHLAMIDPLLEKWFQIPIPDRKKQTRVPGADLRCWNEEWIAKLRQRPVHELAREVYESKKSNSIDSVTAISKDDVGFVKFLSTQKLADDFTVVHRSIVGGPWPTDTYTTLLQPKQGERFDRVVIAFAVEGRRAFLANRRDELAELLKNGIAVCLVDLPGCGVNRPDGDSRGRTSWSTSMSSTLQMHGLTMHDLRLAALRAVAEDLKNSAANDKRPLKVGLWAESFAPTNDADKTAVPYDIPVKIGSPAAALLAIHTVRDGDYSAMLARGGLSRMASTLESPYVQVPHDTFRGPVGEVRDGLAANVKKTKTSQRLEAMIDGRNVRVNQKSLDRDLAEVRSDHFEYREQASDAGDLVEWFVKKL